MRFIFMILDAFHGCLRGLTQLLRVISFGVFWLLTPFVLPMHALTSFCLAWLRSRQIRFLIEGVPAALFALAVSASVYAAWLPTKNNQLGSYLDRALELHEAGDTATAELLMKKVEKLSGRFDAVNFRRGINYELMGNFDRAFQIMQELAPVDKPGYLQAHEWIADKLVSMEDAKAQRLLKLHIDHILDLSPGHSGVHRFQAIHFLRRGEFQMAVYHLSRAVRFDPSLHLQYASLLYRLKLAGVPIAEEIKDDAQNQAALAIRHYKRRIERENLKSDERKSVLLNWSAALVLIGEHRQAVVMLREKMPDPKDADLRNMLGQIYVSWSRSIPSTDLNAWARKFELLNAALEFAPESPAVITQLGVISTMEGPDVEKADALLRELLAQGRAPATIHFILGTRAAEKEDFDAAIYHLEHAVELNSGVLGALNNLAWTLLQRDPPDAARALDFIERAIKFEKNNPSFRETRGQANYLLGNTKDALSDLEFALQHIKNPKSLPKIHETMAMAYRDIGDDKLADVHDKNARVLRERFSLPKKSPQKMTPQQNDANNTSSEAAIVAPFLKPAARDAAESDAADAPKAAATNASSGTQSKFRRPR